MKGPYLFIFYLKTQNWNFRWNNETNAGFILAGAEKKFRGGRKKIGGQNLSKLIKGGGV